MKKSKIKSDALETLLSKANKTTLVELIQNLVETDDDFQRKSILFLRKNVHANKKTNRAADDDSIKLLWNQLECDLSNMDEYGGADYDTVDYVEGLLYDLAAMLSKNKKASLKVRRWLLDQVIPYIESGNSGSDDALHEVAYATAYNQEDLHVLATRLEETNKEWPMDHARRIYRQIGERDKYIKLRLRRMKYGADYHDLATFYWKDSQKQKAIEVVQKGIKEATGRMDELKAFTSKISKKM